MPSGFLFVFFRPGIGTRCRVYNRIHCCCLFYIYANFTSLSLSSIEVYSGRLFFSHVSSVKLFPAVAVLILKILSILFCI